MKQVFLILFFLLSWLFGGSEKTYPDSAASLSDIVTEASSQNATQDISDFNSLCLSSARSARFSGEDNTFAPSVRTINSGRRVHPSTRSSFRVLKAGKVIDRQHFQTFRQTFFNSPSGSFSFSRIIYSIRHLLI